MIPSVSRAEGVASDGELELSVVIPCLNEEKTIATCVGKAVAAMAQAGIRGEVVVSDNGSTDGSVKIAGDAGARVVSCPARGYGAALRFGFEQATGRFVVMGDADDSYDFGELPRFVEKLRGGERFVMGTRLRGAIMPGAMPTLNRHLGTPVLTFLLNRLFGTRISDVNCGMRGFDRKSMLELGVTSTGMEFASEMIIRAAIEGIAISEVPITLHKDKRDRPPHLRPWRDGWRHLRFLLWYAPDKMMTSPGLVALAIGLVLTLSQLAGPFHVGGLLFDIHFMILGLTLSLLGLSSLSMGVAVHAMMPRRKLRASGLVNWIKSWLTFDRAAIAAALQIAGGLACDGTVLWHWLATHRGPLTAGYTRLTLAGLLLVATGFQTLLVGLMVGLARSERSDR